MGIFYRQKVDKIYHVYILKRMNVAASIIFFIILGILALLAWDLFGLKSLKNNIVIPLLPAIPANIALSIMPLAIFLFIVIIDSIPCSYKTVKAIFTKKKVSFTQHGLFGDLEIKIEK